MKTIFSVNFTMTLVSLAITMHEKHYQLCRHEKAYWLMFIMVIHNTWIIKGSAMTLSCPTAATKNNETVGWPSFSLPEKQHLLPSHS